MGKIKYFNEIKEYEEINYTDENNIKQVKNIIKGSKKIPLTYECKDAEFEESPRTLVTSVMS